MIFVEYLEDQHYEDVLYCILDYLNLRHNPFIPFYFPVAVSRASRVHLFIGDAHVLNEGPSKRHCRVLVDPD